MGHRNQHPPCHAQSEATLGHGLANGDSETGQLGLSDTLNTPAA